jgi:FkbM family methyltransferase
MNYNMFYEFLNSNEIKTIFEVGSRDCLDAIDLFKNFNSRVYAFECNPDTINICEKNIKNYNDVILIKKAISDVDGFVKFYPFDLNKYQNPGASSLLKINFTQNRKLTDPDYGKTDVQKEILVESITLDSFLEIEQIENVDLLCMDLQGAELIALNGFVKNLSNTKYIILESCIKSTYDNGTNFFEVNNFLTNFGFKYKFSNKFKTEIPNKNIDGFCEFDVLFERN